jgi:soluble lytic murein transglycosylase-like protein
MSDNTALIAVACAIAAEHDLNSALVCAVIEQESSWNPWAVRYEPGFLQRYEVRAQQQQRFSVTEEYCRAMSYGLMQVMGEDARELGFTGEFLTELCDPHVGVDLGCRYLMRCLAKHAGVVVEALLAYNGGADTTYPAKVLARQSKYATPGQVTA